MANPCSLIKILLANWEPNKEVFLQTDCLVVFQNADTISQVAHEQIIVALAPLLENNHPTQEICDFFTKVAHFTVLHHSGDRSHVISALSAVSFTFRHCVWVIWHYFVTVCLWVVSYYSITELFHIIPLLSELFHIIPSLSVGCFTLVHYCLSYFTLFHHCLWLVSQR